MTCFISPASSSASLISSCIVGVSLSKSFALVSSYFFPSLGSAAAATESVEAFWVICIMSELVSGLGCEGVYDSNMRVEGLDIGIHQLRDRCASYRPSEAEAQSDGPQPFAV